MNRRTEKNVLGTTLCALLLLGTLTGCTAPSDNTEQDASTEATTEESHTKNELPAMEPLNLDGRKLRVTATVNILGDLARVIGGDRVEVTELMGPGIDPHLYKASARDVNKLESADVILYGGFHLEGKMVELLSNEKKAVAVNEYIASEQLIYPEGGDGLPDPHVWFDITLWKKSANIVKEAFSQVDPENKETYQNNAEAYLAELDKLDEEVKEAIQAIPENQRVMITAHDAFGYYGKRYGLEVRGVQGLSTATEAGTRDVQDLADFIVKNKIPAIFVESSVPKRTVEAVIEAAKSRGQDVSIGGELFSDALGTAGTPEGTYLGMVRHNTKVISEALKK